MAWFSFRGVVGLILEVGDGLIFFSGVVGLILEVEVESSHIGQFRKFSRARWVTSRFSKPPLIILNFIGFVEFGFVTFVEKLEFAKCTRRLAICLLYSLFLRPQPLKGVVIFGRLICACRIMSTIHRKSFPIAYRPFQEKIIEPILSVNPI